MSLKSANIKHTECLKSWMLNIITTKGRLVAANAATKAFTHLANQEREFQLYQAKDREVDNSGESGGESGSKRAVVFRAWSRTKLNYNQNTMSRLYIYAIQIQYSLICSII